jgi:hypothetical protein
MAIDYTDEEQPSEFEDEHEGAVDAAVDDWLRKYRPSLNESLTTWRFMQLLDLRINAPHLEKEIGRG